MKLIQSFNFISKSLVPITNKTAYDCHCTKQVLRDSLLTTWNYFACRYNEVDLAIFMAFISRLINKRIANLISKFNVPTEVAEQFDNDYPLEGKGDHYRFFI